MPLFAAAALPFTLTAASAGATAAAGIYGANKSSASNDKASAIQAASSDKATALAQAQADEQKREFDEQQAEQKRQWDVAESNKAPYRAISSDALFKVRDLLGLPQSSAAPMASSGSAPASAMSGSAADLKALIDSGLDPQTAAAQFNKKYGRTTGNEAAYYAPSSQTSGKAVIGLPDAYLSQEPQGWSITNRGGASMAALPTARPTGLPAPIAPVSGLGTASNYAPIIPFSQLMRGVQ